MKSKVKGNSVLEKSFSMKIIDSLDLSYATEPSAFDLYIYYPARQFVRLQLQWSNSFGNIPAGMFIKYSFPIVHCLIPILAFAAQDIYCSQVPEADSCFSENGAENNWRVEKYKSYRFYLYHAAGLMVNYLIYLLNTNFLMAGCVDMNRRYYIMKFLLGLLEPDKSKLEFKFITTPTLNFLDNRTMMSWMDMRRISTDIGKRFYLRI